jgi:glycosyltransferase involved in cell wall biosynthesis
MTATDDSIDLSLVLPVYNEEQCIESTIEEAYHVLRDLPYQFEIIAVDDGSDDGTNALLRNLCERIDQVRLLTLKPNSGQSAAFGVAFRHSKGRVIVTMDSDGQNDPADIPKLLKGLENHDVSCGYRVNRKDPWTKTIGGKLANKVRSYVLKDGIIDTGCSLKAFKAELVRNLQILEVLQGMHRFLPNLAKMEGASVSQIPVNHRPRLAGQSKYTNLKRLSQTIWDLWAVRWMQKRYRRFHVEVNR